jgi:ubiquinone/menaquinone biosynthesis C-methylase UbiE
MEVKLKFKNKKEVLEEYEKTALSYDTERSASFEGSIIDDMQRKLIYKIISQNGSKKILDAGCGTGRILMHLTEKGLECHGIDPSKNMLKQFKQKLTTNRSVTLKMGDIEKIPYGSDTFDCTFTVHVLMHMPDYKNAFKEMYRVTKPNGIIVCDFPHASSPWTKLSLILFPSEERTRLFTLKELKEFFKPYDYKIVGLFSYARTFYKIPVLKYLVRFMEKYLPLPLYFKRHLFVIVKKK